MEKKEALNFEIKKIDKRTGARLGVLHLPHGDVETQYLCLLVHKLQ